MIAKKMLALGKSDSAIRAIAAYGDARRSEIGSENVFDFSIGNPNVPAPEKVKNTLIELLRNEESLAVHGYTAAPGAMAARKAAAAHDTESHRGQRRRNAARRQTRQGRQGVGGA